MSVTITEQATTVTVSETGPAAVTVVPAPVVEVVPVPEPDVVEVVAAGPQGPAGPAGAAFFPPRAVSIVYPSAAEDLTLLYTTEEMTITRIQSHVAGVIPEVRFSLRYAQDRSTAGTEVVPGGILCNSATIGVSTTTLTNATIPANNWFWLTTSDISGAVTLLFVEVLF